MEECVSKGEYGRKGKHTNNGGRGKTSYLRAEKDKTHTKKKPKSGGGAKTKSPLFLRGGESHESRGRSVSAFSCCLGGGGVFTVTGEAGNCGFGVLVLVN